MTSIKMWEMDAMTSPQLNVMISFELMPSSSNYSMIQLKEIIASSEKILSTFKKQVKKKKENKQKKNFSNKLALQGLQKLQSH